MYKEWSKNQDNQELSQVCHIENESAFVVVNERKKKVIFLFLWQKLFLSNVELKQLGN